MTDDLRARCRHAVASVPHTGGCATQRKYHQWGCAFDGDEVGKESCTGNFLCTCRPAATTMPFSIHMAACSCDRDSRIAAGLAAMVEVAYKETDSPSILERMEAAFLRAAGQP